MVDRNYGEREKRVVDDRYNRGAKYLEDLESREPLHFGYRWLNLPDAKTTLELFTEYLGQRAYRKIKVRKLKEGEKTYREKKVRKVRVRKIS